MQLAPSTQSYGITHAAPAGVPPGTKQKSPEGVEAQARPPEHAGASTLHDGGW
jgi:hypothetical protein